MFTTTLDVSVVSLFVEKASKGVTLATEQAEAIQYATLRQIVEGAEVYQGGREIQAVYNWNNDDKWILSECYHDKYVYDVRVTEIEWEINSGLFYLVEPEETAFKLACGLIVEHNIDDRNHYVLYGRNGSMIDRWNNVRDLAETILDTLTAEAEQCVG